MHTLMQVGQYACSARMLGSQTTGVRWVNARRIEDSVSAIQKDVPYSSSRHFLHTQRNEADLAVAQRDVRKVQTDWTVANHSSRTLISNRLYAVWFQGLDSFREHGCVKLDFCHLAIDGNLLSPGSLSGLNKLRSNVFLRSWSRSLGCDVISQQTRIWQITCVHQILISLTNVRGLNRNVDAAHPFHLFYFLVSSCFCRKHGFLSHHTQVTASFPTTYCIPVSSLGLIYAPIPVNLSPSSDAHRLTSQTINSNIRGWKFHYHLLITFSALFILPQIATILRFLTYYPQILGGWLQQITTKSLSRFG